MKHIIHKVKTWMRGKQDSAASPTLVYVMVTPRPMPAADMIASDPGAVLRRLISFSSREALPLAVILPGRPNRRYPDGSQQNGVLVRYATNDQALKVTESTMDEIGRTHPVVVITDNPAIEKFAAGRHCKTLRIETFEKAVESVAGPLRREARPQKEGPRPATPDNRPPIPTTRTPQPSAPSAPKPTAQEPAEQSAPPPEKKERDQAILDLIDPL